MNSHPIEDRLNKIRKMSEQYDTLPDSKRIGRAFTDLQEEMEKFKTEIAQCLEKVEGAYDVDTEPDPEQDGEDEFHNRLGKLKHLGEEVQKSQDLSTDQMVEMYLEMCRYSKWCNDYLKHLELKIEKVD